MYTTEQVNELIENGKFDIIENVNMDTIGNYIEGAEMIYFSEIGDTNRNYYKYGDNHYLAVCSKELELLSFYKI